MVRVAIIGGGPAGQSVMYWIKKLDVEERADLEIVCYEKGDQIGGIWNYSWRTGLDQHGEPVTGSMYRYLWTNAPAECYEFPYYTLKDHFGAAVPSHMPREAFLDYQRGRLKSVNFKKNVHLNTVVRDVVYNKGTDNFTLTVKDLVHDKILEPETFTHVIVATGHFSTPKIEEVNGIEGFNGRVMHSHDFRSPEEFMGKRVLVVGSSYSGEDIATQLLKFGAGKVVISCRTNKLNYNWTVEEKPRLEKFDGNKAIFSDGSYQFFDAVIMATGYIHHYPFLAENLRLTSENTLYPPGLYKGIVWTAAANSKLFYIGNQDLFYSLTMFDVSGCWIAKHFLGDIKLPEKGAMERHWKSWVEKDKAVAQTYKENRWDGKVKGVDLQTEYVQDLVADCGMDYIWNLDVAAIFKKWIEHKRDNILTFRDHSYVSKNTGKESVVLLPNMQAFDDSMDNFKKQIYGI